MADWKPHATILRARRLRADGTDVERLLWRHLRAKQLEGRKWRRQHPIGLFVVDFVCLPARLIVELDGGQHGFEAHVLADAERTAYLEGRGFQVLRFWNNDVNDNIEGVLLTIAEAIRHRPSPPAPLPQAGEGGDE